MKIAAISCARMASTRFPGKCLALLNGKPLLQYTIDFAKEINIPLYIWTRDIEIMEYVKDKCPIIYEPKHLYDTKEDTTREKMAFANKIIDADYLVLLQPTQPIRGVVEKSIIDSAVGLCLGYAYSGEKGYPDGRIYVYSRGYFFQEDCEYGWHVPDFDYFDIDTKEDLERCEKWLQAQESG